MPSRPMHRIGILAMSPGVLLLSGLRHARRAPAAAAAQLLPEGLTVGPGPPPAQARGRAPFFQRRLRRGLRGGPRGVAGGALQGGRRAGGAGSRPWGRPQACPPLIQLRGATGGGNCLHPWPRTALWGPARLGNGSTTQTRPIAAERRPQPARSPQPPLSSLTTAPPPPALSPLSGPQVRALSGLEVILCNEDDKFEEEACPRVEVGVRCWGFD
jgi:hypothetical protein